MKNLIYFSLLVILISIGSCKKKETCDGVVCLNGGACFDGVCYCAGGYTGAQCQTSTRALDSCLNINCGAHGHCVGGICICDSGWSGANCSTQTIAPEIIPTDLFEGYYHMTGYSQTNVGGTIDPPVYYDDTIQIIKIDNTHLSFQSNSYFYTTYYQFDTIRNYNFLWIPICHNCGNHLYFHRTLDDSAFYSAQSGSMASITITELSGVRIY